MRTIASTIGIALCVASILCLASPLAHAQTVDTCRAEINERLGQEQRIYRSILFGVRKAVDEPLGTTRHDRDGIAWIKMDDHAWRSAQVPSTTKTDEYIDTYSPVPERRGIFDARGILTSELIPQLTTSYRALGCRLDTVCEAARLSMEASDENRANLLTVNVSGCIEFKEVRPLAGCFPPDRKVERAMHVTDIALVQTYCQDVAPKILDREAELLKLAVSYDAAYRSLLQFAGNFEQFAGGFRTSLLTPIRQAVSLMGYLHRIPCFLSQCDE